jgi:sec-independent protein translocase protein TatA
MGSFSLSHWIVVLVIILIVFGAGRLPKTMGDLAKGVRALRSGMREDADDDGAQRKTVESQPGDLKPS